MKNIDLLEKAVFYNIKTFIFRSMIKKVFLAKKLKTIHGVQQGPASISFSFQYDFTTLGNSTPTRMYIRGIPDILCCIF